MAGFLSRIKKNIQGITPGTTLYYPGCLTKYKLKEVYNSYKALLQDIGIDFITMNDLDCCGSPLINAGYEEEFEELKKKNITALKKHNIKRIITNCPHCYNAFKKFYDLDIEVKHTSQLLAENKKKLISQEPEEVSYHDPCILAREHNIIREPREALKQAGLIIEESRHSGKDTFCCGAGGGMKQNAPKIADKIARKRLAQLPSKKIITACPYCYAHFKENSDDKNKKKIIEMSSIFTEE